ncbi:MAG: hypothetical protein K0Q62_209 [Phenylobacterium sp.]|nr:hypothetical protein [Phenylobacterium sp.]
MSLPPMLFRAALTSALALALAGCREDVGRDISQEPMFVPAAGAELYDLEPAPAWEELPPAPPAPIGRPVAYDDGYGYAERAYAMDRAFYDVPPDYGFAYEDADPWVWRTDDDYMMFVELIDGGYRRYYYEPGADYPYFIRDPHYGYGFDRGGALVTVYNPSGVLLPYDYLADGAIRAGRYRGRGRVLYETAVHERRLPIVREAWLSRRPTLVASQRPWMEAAVRQKDWRKYRERHDHREIRQFVGERERRKAVIARAERQDFRQAAARAHDVRESRRDERWERSDERERRAERGAPRLEHAVREERVRPERPERPARVSVERDQARAAREARPERIARAEGRKEDRPARIEPRREQRSVAARAPRPERVARADDRREGREAPAARVERRRDEQVKVAAPSRPEQRATRPEVRQGDRRPDRAERRAPKPDQQAEQRRVERPARAERNERGRPERAEQRAEAPTRDRGGERGGKPPKD